jgi:hypothetical protein
VLAGRRGVLSTGTSGLRLFLWTGELAQVFPGAPAEHLLSYHEAACAFLAGQGIEIETYPRDQAMDHRSWGLSLDRAATANASRQESWSARKRVARREPANVGAIQDNPSALKRLAALREEAEP